MTDTEKRRDLTKELQRVDREIAELNERIPPHSVKPHLIQELDELEARRDQITGELEKRNHPPQGDKGENPDG